MTERAGCSILSFCDPPDAAVGKDVSKDEIDRC